MNYNIFLDILAQQFDTYIHTLCDDVTEIPTEDFGWSNTRYRSELFRLAHIERYSDGKIDVLHVTTFPHQWSPEPIFGFDVICTDNKIVGAYMDLSPGLKTYNFTEGIQFEELKPIPAWATVFSEQFLTLKPKDHNEFVRFTTWVLKQYVWYLTQLSQRDLVEWDDEHQVIAVQNRYCEVQASNPRTFTVLKHKIGAEQATHFMQNILFPKIIGSVA